MLYVQLKTVLDPSQNIVVSRGHEIFARETNRVEAVADRVIYSGEALVFFHRDSDFESRRIIHVGTAEVEHDYKEIAGRMICKSPAIEIILE